MGLYVVSVGYFAAGVYLTVDGRIMAVPFDEHGRRVTGEPLQIVSDALGTQGGAALSPTGTLVYLRGTQNQRLVLIDSVGPHPLTDEQRLFATPELSPDGQRVALSISAVHASVTTSDIWIFDRRNKTFTRLTSMGNVVDPRWMPDGKRLLFHSWLDKAPTIWIQQADGSGSAWIRQPFFTCR